MHIKETFQTISKRIYRMEDAELKAALLEIIRSNPVYKPTPNGMTIKSVDIELQASARGDIQMVVVTENFERDEASLSRS